MYNKIIPAYSMDLPSRVIMSLSQCSSTVSIRVKISQYSFMHFLFPNIRKLCGNQINEMAVNNFSNTTIW